MATLSVSTMVVFREEMARGAFVVKYHDGQWNFIPVADIKNKVKENLPI
ncbi:hypothetical protein O9929_27030 [Vibrio lentus]|nr:hypothetical protein [Vibrio lentus]